MLQIKLRSIMLLVIIVTTWILAGCGGGGGSSVVTPPPVEDPEDTTAPVFMDIAYTSSSNSLEVTWTTDEAATSVVHYQLSPTLWKIASTPGLTTTHTVIITGLTPATRYNSRVESTDASGNKAVSEIYFFRTADPTPQPEVYTSSAAIGKWSDSAPIYFEVSAYGRNGVLLNEIEWVEDYDVVDIDPKSNLGSNTILAAVWSTTPAVYKITARWTKDPSVYADVYLRVNNGTYTPPGNDDPPATDTVSLNKTSITLARGTVGELWATSSTISGLDLVWSSPVALSGRVVAADATDSVYRVTAPSDRGGTYIVKVMSRYDSSVSATCTVIVP